MAKIEDVAPWDIGDSDDDEESLLKLLTKSHNDDVPTAVAVNFFDNALRSEDVDFKVDEKTDAGPKTNVKVSHDFCKA